MLVDDYEKSLSFDLAPSEFVDSVIITCLTPAISDVMFPLQHRDPVVQPAGSDIKQLIKHKSNQ